MGETSRRAEKPEAVGDSNPCTVNLCSRLCAAVIMPDAFDSVLAFGDQHIWHRALAFERAPSNKPNTCQQSQGVVVVCR